MQKRNQKAQKIIVVDEFHAKEELLHKAIRVESCVRSRIAEIKGHFGQKIRNFYVDRSDYGNQLEICH